MKNANKLMPSGEIRVNCRLDFTQHLFTPRANEGGKPKYECSIVVDKNDKDAVKLIEDAIERAKEEFKNKYGAPRNKLKTWVKDGDEERPDDPNYAGKLFFSAKADRKPDVKLAENGMLVDALDESEVYSGSFGAAVIRFYPYKTPDNAAGISCGLNAVIKLEDGPRLGGGTSSADFSDLL